MWRLKLKETLERFTVLDCKNWTCGGTPKIQQQQNCSSTTNSTSTIPTNDEEKSTLVDSNLLKCKKIDHLSFGPEIFLPSWSSCSSSKRNSSSGSSSNDDDKGDNHKKISDNEQQLTEDILGAITWSGAIIFGWYASQILCARRRHLDCSNVNDHPKKYLKYLYIPRRTIYSNINSHLVFTSPIQPPESKVVTLSNQIKYVDIPLLDNKLSVSSKKNKNLLKQSQNELNFKTITDDCSTSVDYRIVEKTTRISSNEEVKFLDNEISSPSVSKRNRNISKQSLHQINNSTDSSESSENSIASSRDSKSYSTEDSSSFIVFKENSNDEYSSSANSKIYRKTDVVSPTDNVAHSKSGISSTSEKIPDVDKAVSELVHHIADFEYRTALQHINNKDYKRAVPHLKRATTHSHPSGIFNLGLCYEKGLGVRKDLYFAMDCYQKASNLGHPKATFNLGVFYARGLGGLPKDIGIARKCIITAAKLGQPEAISFLNSMAVKDEEIAKYLKEQKSRSSSIDSGL